VDTIQCHRMVSGSSPFFEPSDSVLSVGRAVSAETVIKANHRNDNAPHRRDTSVSVSLCMLFDRNLSLHRLGHAVAMTSPHGF